MAKGQTSFSDKAKKAAERKIEKRHVRVIKSVKDADTGAIRFSDRMVPIPSDEDMDAYLSKVVSEEER